MKQTKSATKATPTNSTKRLESKRTHVENTNRGISTRRNKINSDKLKLNDKSICIACAVNTVKCDIAVNPYSIDA